MRRLIAVLVALALLVPALPVGAANELQVSVQTGFDGVVRPGTWIPVDINLANAGPNLNGDVELSVQRRPPNQNGFQSGTTIDYAVPISLPQHSSKRFSTAVYVPPFYDQLQVRVVSGQQTLYRNTYNFQRADPTQIVCGVLSTDPTAFDSLGGLTVGDGGRQPHLVSLDLPDLPANPQLLNTLDCLIVSDYSTRGLTAPQQAALSTWVDNGGVLTIGTGPTGASTIAGLPPDLLPASVDGTAPLRSLQSLAGYVGGSADPNGPWLVASLKVGNGAVVVADERQPVLVAARRGKGSVYMLALSLTQKPLRGWDGLDHLWSYMLSAVPLPTSTFTTTYRADSVWGRAPREALIQSSSVAGPDARRLLWALLLFGLLIGPANFLALSRVGRRELMLLSVPVLAGLTTAGAVAYASRHEQRDVVMNQVSIVRTWDGRGTGEAHSFVGAYALHPQNFQIQIPPNALLSNSVFPVLGQNSRGLQTIRVVENGAPEVQGLELDSTSLRSFSLDGQATDPGRVRAALTLSGDQIKGQVVNNLGETIHDAAFVAGTAVQPLGDLRPGASHAVGLRVGTSSPTGDRDTAQIVDRLFPGQSKAPNQRHDLKYAILAAALNPGQSYGGQVALSGVTLLGWLDGAVSPVRDPETQQAAQQSTLFITSLPLQLTSDAETIPSQLLDRQDLSSSYSARIDNNGITVNSGDLAAFQYLLPVDPGHLAIRSLTLATAADGAAPGTLEFYNWRASGWDQVPFTVGNVVVPNPDRYVSATGAVRLRYRYKPPTGGPSTLTFSRFQLQVGGVGW